MHDATAGGFACVDPTLFCRLDELGLEVTGQRVEADQTVLACRVVEADRCVIARMSGVGTGAFVIASTSISVRA